MKRKLISILSVLLATVMLFSFASCNANLGASAPENDGAKPQNPNYNYAHILRNFGGRGYNSVYFRCVKCTGNYNEVWEPLA